MGNSANLIFEDGLATITLSRPDAGNAIDQKLVDDLDAATTALVELHRVRAVLILAEGRHFCVGGDIKVFGEEKAPDVYIRNLAAGLHRSTRRIAGMAVPVVSGVQGAAAGAGLSLAIMADLVVAGDSTKFAMAYTAIGLTADGGASWLLPRLVGPRLALDMALTNRRLSAEEALQAGLISRIVPEAEVQEQARKLARQIAQGPTQAFAGMKRLFAEGQANSLDEQLDRESVSIGRTMATDDAQAAIRAFLSRETPAFNGLDKDTAS